MWMGGVVPLGYDVVARRLVINEAEAETVRTLFRLYQQHANARLVKEEADRRGLRTKLRRPNNGRRLGGEPFTPGHIYKLLSNPIYVGEISHKGVRYPGEHAAIIDRGTWESVQEQLERNAVVRHHNSNAKAPSLLAGILFDEEGNRMVPSHASKAGRRYRYYVSRLASGKSPDAGTGWRLPALMIEDAVVKGACAFLRDRLQLTKRLKLSASPSHLGSMLKGAKQLANRIAESGPADQRRILLEMLEGIKVGGDRVTIVLRTDSLRAMIGEDEPGQPRKRADQPQQTVTLELPVSFRRRGVEMKLVITDDRDVSPAPDPRLASIVAHGRRWFAEIRDTKVHSLAELAKRHKVDRTDIGRAISLSFLAPDIVEAFLEGRQPTELTAARLKRMDLPVSWAEQRRILGFTP